MFCDIVYVAGPLPIEGFALLLLLLTMSTSTSPTGIPAAAHSGTRCESNRSRGHHMLATAPAPARKGYDDHDQ